MKWVFTFGRDHEFPRGYIIIDGDCQETRDKMFSLFGSRWSMQYKFDDFKLRENMYEVVL